MGIGFPFAAKVVQTDLGRLGFRTGALMMSNIVGSTLGTVATGWLGLRLFGTAASLKAVVAASSAFALVGLPRADQRWDRSRLAAAVVVIMLAAAMPDGDVLWTRLHSIGRERIIQAEDESGVSLLKRWGGGVAQGATVFCRRSWPKRASIRRHSYDPRPFPRSFTRLPATRSSSVLDPEIPCSGWPGARKSSASSASRSSGRR